MFKRFFLSAVLLSSALVDVPGGMNAGAISLNGVLTILLSAGIAMFLLHQPKLAWRGFVQIWPLSCLLLFSILQCLWHRPSVQGVQNVCLLWVFVGSIVLISAGGKNELESIHPARLLVWATAIAASCYAASILYDGLGTESLIGARSFAVYALLGLGLLLGRWVHGSRISFWFALGLTLLIALSLSRTALVAGVLLFVLARVQSFSFRGLSRVAVASGIAACGLYFLVTSSDALSARFLGDSPVEEYLSGAASVDASGRLAFWAITVDSFGESPWLGKGPGTANDLIASEFEGMGHPHNEYLRFLHDGGVLALALLLGGCTQLLVLCRRGYSHGVRACSAGRAFYLGTFLAFLAVLFTMITDNTASYLFVMAPLGILIGTCLRSVKKLEQDMAVCAELSA